MHASPPMRPGPPRPRELCRSVLISDLDYERIGQRCPGRALLLIAGEILVGVATPMAAKVDRLPPATVAARMLGPASGPKVGAAAAWPLAPVVTVPCRGFHRQRQPCGRYSVLTTYFRVSVDRFCCP